MNYVGSWSDAPMEGDVNKEGERVAGMDRRAACVDTRYTCGNSVTWQPTTATTIRASNERRQRAAVSSPTAAVDATAVNVAAYAAVAGIYEPCVFVALFVWYNLNN